MNAKQGWDPVWENIFKSKPWGKYPAENLIRWVARNFYQAPDRSKIKILEIGCGPGANLWYLAREGFSTWGIDGSESAIKIARQRLDSETSGWLGELTVGDIGSLPFEGGAFDGVIDNEAIYSNSYEASQNIYREVYRVLVPGGKLFSRTFALGCYGDGSGKSVGHNAWIVSEGPLLGMGYSRFTAEDEIPKLLGPDLEINEVNLMSCSVGGIENKKFVKEWLVSATKNV